MDFTEFDLQRIPYSFRASYLRRNFARFLALDANVWGYYNKLAVFIPNAFSVLIASLKDFEALKAK
ncbi:hypothetical protein HpKG131_06370 [Helicobacter pylori]